MHFRTVSIALALVVGLTACGGGSSGTSVADTSSVSSTPAAAPTDPTVISGTAASGSPITNLMSGVVTLKDSSAPALTAVTATDSAGHYAFKQSEIKGFVAPFVIQVAYKVAGNSFFLHSAVTAQDITGGAATINITPLTDLVVANIAGEIAQNVFNRGAFSGVLTSTALGNGVLALDILLQPVLAKLGLPATLDLLHASFAADGTGLDSLLDAVHVSVDPATRNVVLTNTLNGATTSGTLGAPPTAPLSATGGGTVTDLQAITSVFSDFATVMAGNPTVTSPALLAFFDQANFMDEGQALSSFLQEIVGSPSVAGGSLVFKDISLSSVPSYVTVPAGATGSYRVKFSVYQNTAPNGQHEFILYKSNAGKWLVLGDQLKAKVDFSAFEGNNAGNMCTGLQLGFDDRGAFKDSSNATIPISYAVVTGPGLPTNGVMLFQGGSTFGNSFLIAAQGAPYAGTGTTQAPMPNCSYTNIFAMTDSQIGAITNLPATYTVNLYNVASATTTLLATYTQQVLARPLTSAQLTASVFPTNITSSSSLSTAALTGSAVNITWTAPSAASEYASSLNVFISSTSGGSNVSLDLTPAQTQQLVTPPVTTNVQTSGATVEYIDSAFRTIWASPASPL